MDTEEQFRINFLDEAEDYFDRIESILLELSSTEADPQQLDLALRAAHSIKGGAAMMGLAPLSQVAHRLEDFFKILRVRYHSTQISTEIQTLLLQGADNLRQISELHRQGATIEPTWINTYVDPIFEQLGQYLGELQIEDENALLSAEEDADPALLVFEEGVETILDRFEEQTSQLSSSELSLELAMAAEELTAFGHMANLEAFIELCQSIKQQAEISSPEDIEFLASRALSIWRRSHALVLRGRIEKLPSQLDGVLAENVGEDAPLLDALDALDLSEVQAEFANFDGIEAEEFAPSQEAESKQYLDLMEEITLETEDLADLQAAFAPEEPTKISLQKPNRDVALPQKQEQLGKTVRVPVEQLEQFNNLFGKLILERNTINLRLEQLQNFARLMRERMQSLEQSNTQLRSWYDRASLEGILPVENQSTLTSEVSVVGGFNALSKSRKTNEHFDALEMDRYTDLHLISQEQIETIVQLDEVTKDIELGLREINNAIGDFNQTTKALQENVSRTQMLPFDRVVKRFPRVVRDLSIQFGKQVNLKISGKTTLIDRSVLETLKAPLNHLLRNAFDHGIEDSETRVAAGKSPQGTISLQAVNRGTQTIVSIRDDGGGIDLDKIRDRIRRKGVPQQQIERMSEAEILNFIFEPGFSTVERVTELSGRGVGMDVVRTNLRDIRGDITVETQLGRGTTFILSIPFTLSILRVMLLERAGITFAVSVDSVRELLRLQPDRQSSVEDFNKLTWNNKTIPAIRLEETFRFNRPRKSIEMLNNPILEVPMALIVGEERTLGGIYIDRFWGEQEVTVRPIESPLPLPAGFISSIILGNGLVIPLVDPLQLLEESLKRDRDRDLSKTTLTSKDILLSPPLLEHKTILVVDDSINIRRYLALTLEKAGYQVEQAKDGQEAVDKLFGGLCVQAVICDIEMPRLDGYGVLEEVKAKSEFENLPIVMLTSRSNEKHRKLAANLGASAYLSKPYNEQHLLHTLAELI